MNSAVTSDRALTPVEREALGWEQEAADFPEECIDSLFEAAAAWRRADRPDRAVEVLIRLREQATGEDAQCARVELAGVWFGEGRDDEAYAELAGVEVAQPGPRTCESAGELFEQRQEHHSALRWFDLGLRALPAHELAAAWSPLSMAWFVSAGRRRARAALGLPVDDVDRKADAALAPWLPATAFPTSRELLDDPQGPDLGGAVCRTLFWPRGELSRAVERWPGVFDEQDAGPLDEPGYHGDLEARFRELIAHGARGVQVVPGTCEGLAAYADATGGSAADPATRRGYMVARAAEGAALAWPPERNAACWCGSGRKYKKCCLRAA